MQGEGGARLNAKESGANEPAPNGSSAPPPRSRAPYVVLTALTFCVYALDQASKAWAVATLSDLPPRPLLGDFLRLELIRNAGAAFSLGTGNTWLLTLLAVAVLVVIIRSSRRLGSLGWACAFGLILGGALGNLTDRLSREPGFGRGHVVDFLDYNGWFIGNAADIAIVAAAVLIVILSVRGIGIDGRRDGQP
ncbi:MAG: signal peptidase II [Dermatophilaceae bacterium]